MSDDGFWVSLLSGAGLGLLLGSAFGASVWGFITAFTLTYFNLSSLWGFS